MNRFGFLLACCVLLGACTVVDAGVGRGAEDWKTDLQWNAYADWGWPTTEQVLLLDVVGGPNAYTLLRADLWRLLHVEIGLLGLGLGIGPLQAGIGAGLYGPVAPAKIVGDNPMKG